MIFGMPTLIEIKLLEKCAVLWRELGLNFIEINYSGVLAYEGNGN